MYPNIKKNVSQSDDRQYIYGFKIFDNDIYLLVGEPSREMG